MTGVDCRGAKPMSPAGAGDEPIAGGIPAAGPIAVGIGDDGGPTVADSPLNGTNPPGAVAGSADGNGPAGGKAAAAG